MQRAIIQLRIVARAAEEEGLRLLLGLRALLVCLRGFPELEEPFMAHVNAVRLLRIDRLGRVVRHDHRAGRGIVRAKRGEAGAKARRGEQYRQEINFVFHTVAASMTRRRRKTSRVAI